jgi:hypothetical protein
MASSGTGGQRNRAALSISTSTNLSGQGQALPPPYPRTESEPARSPYPYSPGSTTTYSPLVSSRSPATNQNAGDVTSHRRSARASNQRRATEPHPPKSAGYSPNSPSGPLRFFHGRGNSGGSGIPPTSRGKTTPNRRYSHEPVQLSPGTGERKVNVYTECGRHSDEWLFGPLTDAVKKIWIKDGEAHGHGAKNDDGRGRADY